MTYNYNMKKNIKKIARFLFSKNMFLLISLLLQIALIIFMYSVANKYTTKILGGASSIIAFIVALIINNSKLHSDTKLAYVIILVLFPIYGVLTFLLSFLTRGDYKFKRYLKKLSNVNTKLPQNEDVLNSLQNQKEKGIANYLYNSCGFPIYQNSDCKYFKCGEDLFEAMLEKIKTAEKFVFLEYFIIQKGKLLSSLIDTLKSKVDEGVEVRLMYDGTSSIAKIPHSFVKQMNKIGIKCKMFMPVRAILSSEQNNRDHRKLCIIDNKYAFTGGLNLADEYINAIHPYSYWKDVGVELSGQAVTTYTSMFLKLWNFKQKNIEDFTPYIKDKYIVNTNGNFIPLGDHPHDNEDVSKNLILHILSNAREYVHITTPYLVLDDELRNALCNCCKRGVEVCIVTPNIPDKKIIYSVTQVNYKPLIEAGIKIYQYIPGFIHAKSIICDNIVAVLGTVNLDYRSLYLNFENSLYLSNNSHVIDIEKDFKQTVNESKLIDMQNYKKINIVKRFFGKLLKIIAPLF